MAAIKARLKPRKKMLEVTRMTVRICLPALMSMSSEPSVGVLVPMICWCWVGDSIYMGNICFLMLLPS